MTTAQLVIGIILLVFAVFLIVAVLMQQGKSHNLSGTIAGGAETFFGKSKAQTMNKKLSVLTTVVAIIFVILVSTVYVMQPSSKSADDYSSFWSMVFGGDEDETKADDTTAADEHDHDHDHDTTVADDTTAADVDTTVADAE